MHRWKVEPEDYAFNAALQACSCIKAFNKGNIIHSHMVECHLESDVCLCNTLINMYARCGSLEDAEIVFRVMCKARIVAWCSIISGLADQGDGCKALQFFTEMLENNLQPNVPTYVSILKACSNIGCLMGGKLVHTLIVEYSSPLDLKVANSIIDMYGKCGALEDAYLIFHRLVERNTITWSTLISMNAERGFSQVTLQLFQQMNLEGIESDHALFAGIFKVCPHAYIGKFMHALLLEKGSTVDDLVGSILIEMYFRLFCHDDALKVFKVLPRCNVQPWNAIITRCVQDGHFDKSISYFQGMQMENVIADNTTYTSIIKACGNNHQVDKAELLLSLIIENGYCLNEPVGNALISMYAKCGSLTDSCCLFVRLSKHDAVAWSAIISAHVLHGFGQEALKLFGQMQLHVNEIDNVTFLSVFKACSLISALNQGRLIHSQVVNTEWESDVNVGNSLIDMYSKCGSLSDSLMVFHSLPTKTVVTWNALIAGMANNNQHCLAFKLLKGLEQDGLRPNDITFSSLLSACSQHGMLHEGRCLFESLSLNYGITPEIDHYTCLVGLLSYAGCLVDAACLVSMLPLAPNLVTWTSLLSNSKMYGNLVLGKQASDNLMTVNGHFAPAYALKLFADINLQGNAKNASAA